jgi:hypothetical protein
MTIDKRKWFLSDADRRDRAASVQRGSSVTRRRSSGSCMRGRVRSLAAPIEPLPPSPTDMAWIRTTPLEGDEAALARARAMQRSLYPMMYGESGPSELADESIVASHSLIPDAQYHAFATFGVLMSPDLPLERRHHEMIATMVSVTNRCRY